MFYCTQCNRSSFFTLTYPYLFCGYVDRKSTVSENFNPPESETSGQFGTASGSQSNLLPNNMQMDELARTFDRTSNVLKRRIELDNSSTNKRSRNDICAMTSKALPTCNEQHAMNYDMAMETRPASQIAFEQSTLDSIHNKYPSNKELHHHYQDMLESGNLENYMLQNSASNFDNFQIPQNLNLQKVISNIVAPMREIPYVDDSLAVPGPSGFQEYKNTPNLWVEELQPISSLELQSARVMEKIIIEKKCNLHQHAYIIQSFEMLRCNICEEVIWENKDHDNEETCVFCNQKFQCKTLLERHSLEHESDYTSNCRVCLKTISEHVDPKDKAFYKCCGCDCRVQWKSQLQNHLYTKTGLKLFKCDLCDKRFSQKSQLTSHLHTHFKCEVCGEIFLRSGQLDSHRSEKRQT